MKATAITLGCKVNQYESQSMLSSLSASGFLICNEVTDCDVVLINSCTVTATSDHKVRQTLHRVRRQNPSAVIVLTGCMPQAFPELAEGLTDADIVLGNSNHSALIPHIYEYLSSRQRIIDIIPHKTDELFEKMSVSHFYERTRAFVKIEDGCNRFCSYCIIPYARGRVRSKPLDELRPELVSICEKGYSEIVMTGINLSAYGQDIGLHLCDAIETASAIDGVKRIRLGSLEPEQLTKDIIARLAKQKKLCPQFHLSLQSGCDATLKRMNRHYTSQKYLEIVKNLREAFDNVAITTDLMVGFPGESEEEFQESLDFIRRVAFAKIHVFAYSRRPGTKAYALPHQISNQEKEKRSRIITEAATVLKQHFYQCQVGKIEQVLFERECTAGCYEGYTENYTPVKVYSPKNISGEILPIKIIDTSEEYCRGELI